MTTSIQAIVTAEGDQASLDAYRAGVNAALAAEPGVSIKELHTAGRLEYRLSAQGGLPFPALVDASFDVPDLAVRVEWQDAGHGVGGSALIQAGALKEQDSARVDAAAGAQGGAEVRAAADGSLALAVVCRRRGEDWIGYVLTADQHAFFRVRPGPVLEATDGVELEWAERWHPGAGGAAEYAELDPREPLETRLATDLGRLADAFAAEWVWFAADEPVDTAVERARFAAYGYPVREANLKTAKLRGVMRREGDAHVFDSLDAAGRGIAALVARHWLPAGRH